VISPADDNNQNMRGKLIRGEENDDLILQTPRNDEITSIADQLSTAYDNKPSPTLLIDPEELIGIY
jgi:hypothetical protein